MERGEVDLLGGDELVAGLRAEVFDVVYEEGVGKGVLGKQDELCASRGKTFGYFGADTGCTSL